MLHSTSMPRYSAASSAPITPRADARAVGGRTPTSAISSSVTVPEAVRLASVAQRSDNRRLPRPVSASMHACARTVPRTDSSTSRIIAEPLSGNGIASPGEYPARPASTTTMSYISASAQTVTAISQSCGIGQIHGRLDSTSTPSHVVSRRRKAAPSTSPNGAVTALSRTPSSLSTPSRTSNPPPDRSASTKAKSLSSYRPCSVCASSAAKVLVPNPPLADSTIAAFGARYTGDGHGTPNESAPVR